MILAIELIIIFIGIGIFLVQKNLNQEKTPLVLKIIYWTIMLFISLAFNSIQVYLYPYCYNIETYLNLYGLINLGIIILLYIVIQGISPSASFKNRIIKRKSKKDNEIEMAVENALEEPLQQDCIIKDESIEFRERHYEIFLETICWFTFVLVLLLQALDNFGVNSGIVSLIGGNLINTASLILALSTAVIIRQLIFYLKMIRKLENKKTISKSNLALTLKLEKENINL